jgi:hypothetical protein
VLIAVSVFEVNSVRVSNRIAIGYEQVLGIGQKAKNLGEGISIAFKVKKDI